MAPWLFYESIRESFFAIIQIVQERFSPSRFLEDVSGEQDTPEPKDREPSTLTVKEKEQNLRGENKWRRVQHVQQLHAAGMSIRDIARTTGLSRQTIRTYLTWTEVPKTNRTRRKTLLDPY
jgi:lambda repressor-like predicted transcriptional regulator